ncbi:MAG: hypothetical protein EXQ55_02140 [Acidobacteria bacterium]|nr:hypothetical protein [Acidobacteriota bacterium]
MRFPYALPLALAGLMACPAALCAQSLADVARAEEARRKAVKVPAKVYTNTDLRGGGSDSGAPAPAQPAAAATKPADPTAKPENPDQPPAAAGDVKDEKYWRARITAVQQAMTRNNVLLDALQSRVNALNTDFANTDDPAQRAVVEDNRKIALAEMDRMKKEIENQTGEISKIQEEARKANVPPGWLR